MFSNSMMMSSNVAASGFNPIDLIPYVWLDFTDPTKLWQDTAKTIPVTASNDPVAGVDDLSGLGTIIQQSTATKRPLYKTAIINGLGGIQLDGVDDFLGGDVSQAYPFTTDLYMVLRLDVHTNGDYILSSKTGSGYSGNVRYRWGGGVGDIAVGGGVSPYGLYGLGSFHLLRCTMSATGMTGYKNDVSISSVTSSSWMRGNIIGAGPSGGAPASISVCEYILQPAVSSADNTNMVTWFNSKYGGLL